MVWPESTLNLIVGCRALPTHGGDIPDVLLGRVLLRSDKGGRTMVAQQVIVGIRYGIGGGIGGRMFRDEIFGVSARQLAERISSRLEPQTREARLARIIQDALVKPNVEVEVSKRPGDATTQELVLSPNDTVISEADDRHPLINEVNVIVSEPYVGG